MEDGGGGGGGGGDAEMRREKVIVVVASLLEEIRVEWIDKMDNDLRSSDKRIARVQFVSMSHCEWRFVGKGGV